MRVRRPVRNRHPDKLKFGRKLTMRQGVERCGGGGRYNAVAPLYERGGTPVADSQTGATKEVARPGFSNASALRQELLGVKRRRSNV